MEQDTDIPNLLEYPLLPREFIQDLRLRKHITPRTVSAYLYDLKTFYTFLVIRRVPSAPTTPSGSTAPPPPDWTAVTLDHLRSLTYDLLRDFLLQFQSPVSTRHQQRKAAVLRSFFRYLVDVRQLLDRNPALRLQVGIDRQQRREDLRQALSLDDQQLRLFLENVRTGIHLPTNRAKLYHQRVQHRDWAIIMLFLTSGLRLSELAGICAADLDLVHNRVHVRRKGGFEDWVPLHPEAQRALTAYLNSGERPVPANSPGPREAPLFVATTTRRRLTPRQIENLVKRYAVTADPRLQFVSPHKLRHTFAQRIYDATGDLYLTAVSLAHQSVESARIYAKVSEEQRNWAMTRLSLEGILQRSEPPQ